MSAANKVATTLLVLLCWAVAIASHAQDAVGVEALTGTLKKVRTTGAITIGFRDASIPFSYLGPGRRPIGYSIDLCLAIVEQIKTELGIDALAVKYLPVNPQTRIRFDCFNLFNTNASDITYYYTSRLPGEPPGGVADFHFHPMESRTFRLALLYNV